MARIDSLGEPYQYPVPDRKKTGRKDKAQGQRFSEMVESAAEGGGPDAEDLDEQRRRHTVEEMLDAVFSAGDILKKTPTLEAIKDYKHKVREFIKYAVEHSIAVEETTSGTNILKRKRFTLMKVIDEKLEALALSVLGAQKEQMAILARIDEINGLLVDFIS
ncbi:MAG TPA: DUF327 family protein [Spirochaetia bacterium]